MRKYLLRCLGALAIAAILLLLISAFINDPCSILPNNDTAQGICSLIGYRIYHFQTLITGIIAIFVAWATIYQMRQSDNEQAERHTSAREIDIRKDVLKMQKVYIPFWSKLASAEEVFRALNTQLRSVDKTKDKVRILINSLDNWRAVQSVSDFVRAEQLTDIKQLLTSKALLAVQDINLHISNIEKSYGTLNRYDEETDQDSREYIFDHFHHDYSEHWGSHFENSLLIVQESIKIIVEELSSLRSEYALYWDK